METLDILDVTVIEPRLKHPTIFARFDELTGGEGFIIHNDHDPKPLYYQLLGERGNIFKWEYLEQGPEVWQVRITKLTPEEGETIGELVAKDYRKAQIFKKYGLDFCCGGKKSVKAACEEKGIDADAVERELNTLTDAPTTKQTQNFDKWELGFLADYIENNHHTYVREALPALTEYTTKIARVHGQRHPELLEVAKHFAAVAAELNAHMPKEERILFPYIKQLAEAKKKGEKISRPAFGTIQNPINMMEMEHEAAGNAMEAIRQLTNNYTLPADACATYRVAFSKLQEFEDDLHQHIHLENNILFPKAVELEKELL
ncbi:MAG: iron-sulfur cluster repair di-iron protein [Hymenobacteraceae bacterium]|nr:iron-sulfur cluster repair di-iron protein [Hymenobacteraceae bacterium]MDX5396445.1 iron-sulfur cluster repair di-iron protein [Hymenobacteraceae bacterium]MDX5443470.1 iron-sulfur cluster repair di-iron protein [Hymenobacteraceae bacterium]MDX5512506.1 iron-sulfur cluster repair di-iron protein [Hymenobacteraceae bacterium]